MPQKYEKNNGSNMSNQLTLTMNKVGENEKL